MEKLTTKKKLAVVRQYLSGLSYDEIAAKSGISKGGKPPVKPLVKNRETLTGGLRSIDTFDSTDGTGR